MQKRSLFEKLNENNALDGLELDRDALLEEIGISRRNARGELEIPDFAAMPAEDSWDLCVLTLHYSEYVSEVLALTKKRRKDMEAESEEVYGSIMGENTGSKITEARALAKGSPRYVAHLKRTSSLLAWEEYLTRFLDVLSRYHYLAKQRTDELVKSKQKSHNIST